MIKKSFLKKAMALAAAVCMMIVAAGCKTEEEDSDVPLTGISLDTFIKTITDGTDNVVSVNNSYSITPDFTPSDATNKGFTLSVSAAAGTSQSVSCVTLDTSANTITGDSAGAVTLTVTAKENSAITKSCTISVKNIALTGISFSPSNANSVFVARTVTYLPVFTPSNASDKGIVCTSGDTSIATVDASTGLVTGVLGGGNDGTAKTVSITATSTSDNGISASYILSVYNVLPTAISLSKTSFKIMTSGACDLVPVFTPSDTTDKSVTYSVASGTSATVDSSGVVTGDSAVTGSTVVTVTSSAKNSLTASATITVVDSSTLLIEENDKASGFVSTTGTIKSYDTGKYTGYSGQVIDSLGSEGNVIYSVYSATSQDVKALIHYAFWGTTTELRGAYLVVNGSTDSEIIYCNWTSKNGTNDNIKYVKATSYNASTTYYALSGGVFSAATGVTDSNYSNYYIISGYHSMWEDSNEITISLDAGENQIRIIPVSKGASLPDSIYPSGVTLNDAKGTAYYQKAQGNLPNIDYFQLTGSGLGGASNTLTFYSVTVTSDNTAFGTVSASPVQDFYKSGKSVTVTAYPVSGYSFNAWTGTISSSDAAYTFTVDKDMSLVAHFIPSSYTSPTFYGYGAVTDDSATPYTISGGAGGKAVTISTLADLQSMVTDGTLAGDAPYIITFSGTIGSGSNVSLKYSVGSNKTIYGSTATQGHLKNIELSLEGSNIIVRNMVFSEVIAADEYKGAGNDALGLGSAEHVWIDHCEFYSHLTPKQYDGSPYTGTEEAKDYYDGLLDIKNGSRFVTVSNCYFHDHWKACLCGSSDVTENNDTIMRLTFYGNYFYNVGSRMPLFRYGKLHMYNNYFKQGPDATGASAVNMRLGSEGYFDYNYFEGLNRAIGNYFNDEGYPLGFWNVNGNKYDGCSDCTPSSSTTSWKPAYTYSNLETTVNDVPSTVLAAAGVGKLTASDLQ